VAAFVVLAAIANAVRRPPAFCQGCNVVLISVDTLRADHVSAYGYARATTPRIDALARGAVLFENAISQSSWTRPAHASMLTGLYPSEHGITSIRDGRKLAPDVRTLAGELKRAGYRTAAFTGGGNMSAHFGFDRGFSVYRERHRRLGDHTRSLAAWLDAAPGVPFFVLLHGFDAHKPYRARPCDRRALALPDGPPRSLERACKRGGNEEDRRALTDGYDAAVHRADAGVGRLLEVLARRGLLDRTVVVLTADHGEELFDHGGCFHVRTLHREILHVPLVVAVPGVRARRVAGIVPASVTVPQTLLDLVGVPAHLPGASLAGVVGGEEPRFAAVVSETQTRTTFSPRSGPARSVTGERAKVVAWVVSGRVEYFDLANDASEHAPVVGDARAATLLAQLDSWASTRRATEPAAEAPLPPALAHRLGALGYLD
jgi:arylsulfatase A-like enzyme